MSVAVAVLKVRVTSLVMSAARRPADVTTKVCGAPRNLDAIDKVLFVPVLELCRSRKEGIFDRFRCSVHALVTWKAFSERIQYSSSALLEVADTAMLSLPGM